MDSMNKKRCVSNPKGGFNKTYKLSVIYTDGSCLGNGKSNNVGGWAYIINNNGVRNCNSGRVFNTTNQVMELTACLEALKSVPPDTTNVDIYSDSAYLINCMLYKWYEKWIRKNWINSTGGKVVNRDLWEQILQYNNIYIVRYKKVHAHSGDLNNERVDKMARDAAKGTNLEYKVCIF